MSAPRSILKRSPPPLFPTPKSACHNVHFPPSPTLTRAFPAYPKALYDRTPIAVEANACALPARGCPGRTYAPCTGRRKKMHGQSIHNTAPYDDDEDSDLGLLESVCRRRAVPAAPAPGLVIVPGLTFSSSSSSSSSSEEESDGLLSPPSERFGRKDGLAISPDAALAADGSIPRQRVGWSGTLDPPAPDIGNATSATLSSAASLEDGPCPPSPPSKPAQKPKPRRRRRTLPPREAALITDGNEEDDEGGFAACGPSRIALRLAALRIDTGDEGCLAGF